MSEQKRDTLRARRRPARAVALVAAAALLALASTVAASAGPGAAAEHLQIDDPSGDVGAAPDLGQIDVGNDVVTGPIVIWINMTNRDRLGAGDTLSLFLDTDQNPATGGLGFGIDYIIGYLGGTARLFRIDGESLSLVAASSLKIEQYDKSVRVSIQPSELGGTRGFAFFLAASNGGETDFAPDDGPAAYGLQSGPLVLTVEHFAVQPKVARAGKRLTAVLLPGRDDTWEILWEGAVRCTAKAGTKPVSVRTGWGDSGAFCSLAVPRAAKGKRLTVALSVTFGGQTVSRTYRSVVR